MAKEIINVPGLIERRDDQGKLMTPLSNATKGGGFVYISGITPNDPITGDMVSGNIEAQTERVMENLKMVLEAAGTSFDNVIKSTVFCTNVGHFGRVNAVYRRYFTEDEFPARTFVNVGSWPRDFDIEIEMIALAE